MPSINAPTPDATTASKGKIQLAGVLSGTASSPTFSTTTGAWVTWSPTWTNLTLGNGTLVAKYNQIGKTVDVFLQLTWGTTTSASGAIQFSLPVTGASQYSSLSGIGSGFAEDAGVAGYPLLVHMTSTTTVRLQAQNKSNASAYVQDAAVSNTVPFTWGNGDKYSCSFTYEAA